MYYNRLSILCLNQFGNHIKPEFMKNNFLMVFLEAEGQCSVVVAAADSCRRKPNKSQTNYNEGPIRTISKMESPQ